MTKNIFSTIILLMALGAIGWNVKTCNDPYRIVKGDEGTFLVPSDAVPFGSMHIYEGHDAWMLWLNESDEVTVVHHAKIVGYQK